MHIRLAHTCTACSYTYKTSHRSDSYSWQSLSMMNSSIIRHPFMSSCTWVSLACNCTRGAKPNWHTVNPLKNEPLPSLHGGSTEITGIQSAQFHTAAAVQHFKLLQLAWTWTRCKAAQQECNTNWLKISVVQPCSWCGSTFVVRIHYTSIHTILPGDFVPAHCMQRYNVILKMCSFSGTKP